VLRLVPAYAGLLCDKAALIGAAIKEISCMKDIKPTNA
jgi:hypothetical protein